MIYAVVLFVGASALGEVRPMTIDAERVRAAGLRTLTGKHVAIYTDVPSSPAVDELPRVFDAAVPLWATYFGVPPNKLADWRMNGFVIKDRAKFVTAGVIPDVLPPFINGYSIGYEFWMNEQPSDYYRRHLMLHEGTHGFMNTQLGNTGPPWFMEGVAELLGTHRWQTGTLTLGYTPHNSDEVPMLGRVQYVREDVAAERMRALGEIVNDAVRGYVDNPSYAWCWAFASFLEGQPRYRDRFHLLQKQVLNPKFNDEFRKSFAADLPDMQREWLVYANELEYGVEGARVAIDFESGKPLPPVGAKVTVAADRGWQSSGVRLEAGKTYLLKASGRYQIAITTKPWPCEPGGVTIRYYRGRPLGMLLASVEPDGLEVGTPPPMLKPMHIGRAATLKPEQSGTLYFRVNDSNGELSDNVGSLTVEIAESP